MDRSSEAKDGKNPKKVKCDGPTDRWMDGLTKQVVKLYCMLLENDAITRSISIERTVQ